MPHREDGDQTMIPIPGPSRLPVVGNLFDIDTSAGIESLMKLAETYGAIFQLNLGGEKLIIINSRDLLDELCNEARFCKVVSGALERLRDGAGDGLFTAHEGEENWGIAHRIIMPIFGPIKIREMFPKMTDIAEELCLKWARYGASHSFEATDDFTRLTLDTIALCSMDYRFNSFYRDGQLHPFVGSMTGFLIEADKQSTFPSIVNDFRRKAKKDYKHDITNLRQISKEIIKSRRENPVDTPDLLNALLLGKDPKTGKGLKDDAIINNMITFLIAGHETTSGLLSFTLFYFLKNPEAYQKAQEEVDSIIGRDNITVDHLSKLPYITASMRETLRVMPTAPAFSVMPREDTIIGGKFSVKKGEPLTCLLPTIHRDKTFWGEDANDWKPERMLDEQFSKIKPNSWKPFGNGARGCIGRAFAWQETQLVLAMLLQNFNIKLDDPSYKLQIKESLTIKPDNFRVNASLRHHGNPTDLSHKLSLVVNPETGSLKSGASSQIGSNRNSTQSEQTLAPITILYGSNSGTCEALAHRLASHAMSRGFIADKVDTLDSARESLPQNQPVVIIAASYDGEPGDNAARFMASLESAKSGSFRGISYAVFGCGHRDWHATLHKIPIMIDKLLEKKGAKPFMPLGTTDAGTSDMFSDFEAWEENLWPCLQSKFGTVSDGHRSTSAPSVRVNVSHPRPIALGQNVGEGIVTYANTLTKGGPVKKHIEIKLPEGMTYETGDYLAVLPLNPRKNVQRTLAVFKLARDSVLEIESSSTLPTTTTKSAADLFESYVELAQLATPGNIKVLAACTTDEPLKLELLNLAGSKFDSSIREKKVSVLDLLERYNKIDLSVGAFLELLPPLRVRTYSISSSPKWNPSHASLTFSVVNQPSLFNSQNRFLGVASNYLSELEKGDVVRVLTRLSKPAFHLPKDPNSFPVIMIAAGSGLAPFRGFLQERSLQFSAGMNMKPAILFFGCRSPDLDDIHRDELDKFEAEGIVKVYRAYSTTDKIYVQNKLLEENQAVMNLWVQGAKAFVCGSSGMVDAVKRIFKDISGRDLDPDRFIIEVFA